MDIPFLIDILQKKIIVLNNAKAQAFSVGDIVGLNAIDKDLLSVQNTLAQLNLLTNVAQAADAANATPAEVVDAGAQTIQMQGPSASAIINGYDISAYATDAFFEQKIQTLVNAIPTSFASAADIDTYIQAAASTSPITGEMVFNTATEYAVDMSLMLAIMQNDSDFGTLGVGARTFNPGNIGNTGAATRSFASWLEGVAALASWLNDHRVTPVEETPVETPVQTPDPVISPAIEPVVVPPTPIVEQATTTPSIPEATTTPATSTPVIENNPIVPEATSTIPEIITPAATSTPDAEASTTQASRPSKKYRA